MSEIKFFNENYKIQWDEYVNKSPLGTFYHLTAWKEVIEKTFGLKSLYLTAVSDADQIEGIFPMFLMKDIFGRKYLVSNPSSNYAGLCTDNKETGINLMNRAQEIAVDCKAQYLEMRQMADEIFDLPTKKDFVTMFLKLHGNEELVWKNSLEAKTRNQIRKAEKADLTVDLGSKYLDDFYRVLSVNFRDLGTPIYPKEFFRNILEGFKGLSDLIVVKYQNKVIGGMLFICYKKVFSDPWASSLKEYNRLCANNMLYWEAIKYACRNGFEYFDFGRSTVDSGTYNFKKQWGAEPVQLNYQYFLNRMQKMPEVNANENKYQTVINLWKRLPLIVANTLGPRVVRYLPEL